MSTSELERRLGDVLRQHAEGAMNDTDTEQQLEILERGIEIEDRGRRRRGRVVAALAVAASLAVVAILVTTMRDDSSRSGTPAGDPSVSSTEVATNFLDAMGRFDVARMETYLAPGAQLTIWGAPRDIDWIAREARWLQATGFSYSPGACTSDGPTLVVCTYDYHGFGSQRLGRGPFTDSFALTVEDGRIVDGILTTSDGPAGFASQMYQPFAGWVATNHPDDGPVMYADWPSINTQATDDRAIRVWVRLLAEYQEAAD